MNELRCNDEKNFSLLNNETSFLGFSSIGHSADTIVFVKIATTIMYNIILILVL